ncbi:MAG TPA: AraC family transcriptional regulator [Kofleriaceae bacterium]|nr:AraC family transcriptional regulator [Kofleriaceae bacterium]
MGRVRATHAIRCVVGFAAHSGVPAAELLRAAELDPALLTDLDADLFHADELGLWAHAARLTGDRDFGLHLAEWLLGFPPEQFDVLAFAARSSDTLRDNYRRVARYLTVIHDGIYLSLEEEGDVARLVHGHRVEPAVPPRHPIEGQLALALLQGRRAIGESFAPRVVRFVHPRPADQREHQRIFRAPVEHGAPRNVVVFDRALLDRRQHHADRKLAAMVDRQLEALLAKVPDHQRVVPAVRSAMVDALPHGEPAIAAIARKLHMSPRSLQRRLRDEGTSFAASLSAVRHELALRYLHDRRIAIAEVGFLLGFVDVSSFYRAFRRWTGLTPAEHRRVAFARDDRSARS